MDIGLCVIKSVIDSEKISVRGGGGDTILNKLLFILPTAALSLTADEVKHLSKSELLYLVFVLKEIISLRRT